MLTRRRLLNKLPEPGEERSARPPPGTPIEFTLLDLSLYAPELNPMENVWAYLRATKLCALVWDRCDAILDACKCAWHFLVNDPARIQSIGLRDWAWVNL